MSIENTLAERGNRYGDFTDHADLAQGIQFRMQRFCLTADNADGFIVPWKDRLNNVQRQALTVISDKIARILSGDPNYADNWHDIQGYAKLVEDRLPQPAEGLFDEAAAVAAKAAADVDLQQMRSAGTPIDPADVDISDEAEPEPDLYDWQTWKQGDLLVCEQLYREGDDEPAIGVGDFVRVLKTAPRGYPSDLPVKVNHDVLGDIWPDHEDYDAKGDDKPPRRIFRFHSRPTK